jgi:hypothetical protein
MESRRVISAFPAFTLTLNRHFIPEGAVLEDFRIGRGHEGLRPEDQNIVSFHYDGRVYFNLRPEVLSHTEHLLWKTGELSAGA